METRFNGGLLYFLLVYFVRDIAGQIFTTASSNGSASNSSSNRNTTIVTCREDVTCKRGTLTPFTALAMVIGVIVMVFCVTTCCSASARRRNAERERRRAESRQQLFNGYASLMVAVIFNIMAGGQTNESSTAESGRFTNEFKGPPTYEEVTRSANQAPPPYTEIDLSRSTSVRESNT